MPSKLRWTIPVLILGLLVPVSPAAEFVIEPEKRIPVVYDVDVAVAGGGVSGVFAAIAAARSGARTVLIERFGSVGGTGGPGLNPGGGVQKPGPWKGTSDYPHIWIYPEIAGIPREFGQRLEKLRTGPRNRLELSSTLSYLGLKMLEEAGVHLLLSTYAADPIMEGSTVQGIFVENKSGRQAVKAKVVIDATGEADVARRAGAPILYPKKSYHDLDGHAPTGMGVWAYIGGVDWKQYNDAIDSGGPDAEPEFSPHSIGDLAQVVLTKSSDRLTALVKDRGQVFDTAGLKIQLVRPHGRVDAGDGLHISRLETETRLYTYEVVELLKREVPGCENVYLLTIAAFLGARGGPCILGEYTLTQADCLKGRRFEDVVGLYGDAQALRQTCIQEGECKWVDVPYRVMVPRRIDGLLAVGRSASGIPDTLLRTREAVRHMGQVGGMAAALAVQRGIRPRDLDVKELQKRLLGEGFYLGDEARLKKLELR